MTYNKAFNRYINDSFKNWMVENMYHETSGDFWVEYYDIGIENGTVLNADRWNASILWEELNRKNPEVAIVSIERL